MAHKAALVYNSVQLGVLLGVITFSITFPLAQQILPFFIREGSKTIEENTNFRYPGNWHKYFMGFAFIIFLLGALYEIKDSLINSLSSIYFFPIIS